MKMHAPLPFFLRTFTLSLLVSITSCAYLPASKPALNQDESCQMLTNELELKEVQLIESSHCAGDACAIFIAVPASSFIVSGSIVLIGNTLHWLEKNGTCSQGFIRKNLDEFIEWAFKSGGTQTKR